MHALGPIPQSLLECVLHGKCQTEVESAPARTQDNYLPVAERVARRFDRDGLVDRQTARA